MDFTKMNDAQLTHILAFANLMADKYEDEQRKASFADVNSNAEPLDDVEKTTREFAQRRNAGLRSSENFDTQEEKTELDEIKANIRDYYRRTRKKVRF